MSIEVRATRHIKCSIPVFAALCLVAAAVPFSGTSIGRAIVAAATGAAQPGERPVAWRDVAGRAVVQTAGRGSTWIQFEDGLEVETDAGAKSTGRPFGLARADFDGDGMPDLAVASGSEGAGAVRVYRGNLGSVYPNAPEARAAVAAGEPDGAPFHVPPSVVSSPVLPEFVAAGDFDGDGNADLAVAKAGDEAVHLIAGDGVGGFKVARRIPVGGAVAAMTAGDVDRPDGRPELLVGVSGAATSRILVVSGPSLAGRREPTAIAVPGRIRELASGDVTGTSFVDVVAVTTAGVALVPGTDSARGVTEPSVDLVVARSDVRSVALGDFDAGFRSDIAMLGPDGRIDLLVGKDPGTEPATAAGKPVFVEAFAAAPAGAERIVAASVSARPGSDLVALDRTGHTLSILEGGEAAREASGAPLSFPVSGVPVGAIPMRLNPDAIDDLVVVTADAATPVVLTSSRLRAPFAVTNTNDSGAGSLRDAITMANSLAGADSITFNIAGPGPHVIAPISALPQIDETLDIDGTTEPDFAGTPVVVLDGSGAFSANGLQTASTSNVKVRGLVIRSFTAAGIYMEIATSTIVEGCYIGTTVSGAAAAPNATNGVIVRASSMTTVGGTTTAARNVISGNAMQGLQVREFASDTLVLGNYIGVNAAGTAALGNGLNGVEVSDSSGTFVGNGASGAANVISGNTAGATAANGVYVHGGMAGMNAIQGNIIGLAANGTTALGNGANGVLDDADNTLVGGPTSQLRNIISGNVESGIRSESQSFGTTVWGNYIGLDINGVLDRGNGNDGVWIAGGGLATVGGLMPGEGNVCSGNQFAGVKVSGGFSHFVATNVIGLDAAMMSAVPNSLDGVRLAGGASISVVLNIISGNSGNGIGVTDGTELEFAENQMILNGGLGIDLGLDGVTANDMGDGDSGAGDLQNFPVISSAVTDSGITTVMGTLNSLPNENFRIHFYISPSCDGSGFGEGLVYGGFIDVATDMFGDTPFSFNLITPAASGDSVTATASLLGFPARQLTAGETAGRVAAPPTIPITTSEFSACFPAMTLDANVSVSMTDAPDPVLAGNDITYTLTVNNAGPLTANNALVNIATPPNTTFQSASVTGGWSVSQAPPMGGTGLVVFSNAMFMTGGPQQLTLVVRVDNFTSGGTNIPAMAAISSDVNDPMPSDNIAATSTTVQPQADISVNKIANVSSAMPGEDVTYTVTVSGSGFEDAANPVLTDVVPPNTTFQSIVAPMGWSVMTPPVNGTGSITATRAQLDLKTFYDFTITVRINTGTPGGILTNTATLASSTFDPDNSNNSSSADVTIVAPPAQADLSVSRIASPDPAIRGQNLTYTITVTNLGPDASQAVFLNETLPDEAELVSFDLPPGWSLEEGKKLQGGPIIASTTSLAANASVTFTLVVAVDPLVMDGVFLVGSSSVFSNVTPDPVAVNNSATSSTPVTQPPTTDLVLDKSASPTTVAPGSAVTYTLIASNGGTADALDVTVTDATPPGTTFVSASASTGGTLTTPSAGGTGSISCVWAGLTAPGESRTLTITVSVGANVADGTSIVNAASTSSLAFESDSTNNSDSVAVLVSANENLPTADLDLSLGSVPDQIPTGEQIAYAYRLRNNGPDTAENVILRTSSPLGTRFVSVSTTQGTSTAPPAGGMGLVEVTVGDIASGDTVTVTVTVNVVSNGGLELTSDAVIVSDTNDPVAENNTASAATTVVAGSDVLLTWDPPIPTTGDERNPPLHLQTETLDKGDLVRAVAARVANPRNTLVGYNIYRSNNPNAAPVPANFYASLPPNQTSAVAPTAPGGSFFVITAVYPNGESDGTNAASGGIPEPDITSFEIRGGKVIINGADFTNSVSVFIDGIPFSKAAKVKKQNTRIQQKGRLLTGQSVSDYVAQQGGVVLVSVLNSDTGIGTFLYRR